MKANGWRKHRGRAVNIRYGSTFKRVFDCLVGFLALAILSPVLASIALLVSLALGTPILFRQVRIGWRGVPFTLFKFRTMIEASAPDGRLRPDHERLPRAGRYLRALSLDELPELWNVLKGDMSLVGPRPLLLEYLPLYTPEQARRHEVRPGITGWAQIHGRNALTWDEKFKLDVWYVDNQSTWLDLKILCRTLVLVLRRDGISAEGHATMPPFTGGNDRGGAR